MNRPGLTKSKKELEQENSRLKKELDELKTVKKSKTTIKRRPIRATVKWLCFSLALALLMVANITFYAARTAVETDKFMEVASPLIREPAVQEAIADKTTKALFAQVDTEQILVEVLPERAAILAPALSSQIQKFTYDKSKEILASDGFQTTYDQAVRRAHQTFIDSVKNYQGDGTINVGDLYSALSLRLQDTKLNFLADKQLPEKIGSIQVIEAKWLPQLHNLVVHLNTIRLLALVFFILLIAVFLWLSGSVRRSLLQLGVAVSVLSVGLIASVILAESLVVTGASGYPEAGKAIYTVLTAPLIEQTTIIVLVGAATGLMAWLGGSSRVALTVKRRVQSIFGDRLHNKLFKNQNSVNVWTSKNQQVLQIMLGVLFIVGFLFIDINLSSILSFSLICLVVSLALVTIGGVTAKK